MHIDYELVGVCSHSAHPTSRLTLLVVQQKKRAMTVPQSQNERRFTRFLAWPLRLAVWRRLEMETGPARR